MSQLVEQLENVPSSNDKHIREEKDELYRNLYVHQLNNNLRVVARYIHVATLSFAGYDKDKDMLLKSQGVLFDMLKLCDESCLMMQNLQSGASNILEKLKVGFLYLLDGLEDVAMDEIESIKENIKSMHGSVKKNNDKMTVVANGIRKLADQANLLIPLKSKDYGTIPKSASRQNYDSERTQSYERSAEHKSPGCFAFFWKLLCCQKDDQPASILRQPSTAGGSVKSTLTGDFNSPGEKEAAILKLAVDTLSEALPLVKQWDGVMERLLPAIDDWYKECQDIVVPKFADSIRAAGDLSKEKRVEYWKSPAFSDAALKYYNRWRALQLYCEEGRPSLKETRGMVEKYYTENLEPSRARDQAWRVAKREGLVT